MEAKFPEDTEEVRALFLAYSESLPVDLEFQNFGQELAALPGEYAPPAGRLLLARSNAEPAGCVGLKRRGETICEMKRLFVLPRFRSEGAGRRLAEAIIVEARAAGYHTMLLDSLPTMEAAQALYRVL
jgi:GNAT superfamily N-acetyltransferase